MPGGKGRGTRAAVVPAAARTERKPPHTREKGIRAVQEGGEALAAALTTAGDRLGETVQAPWGEQLSLYQLSQVAANHILYHDGQLNYLQALKGDGDMHWFD